MVLLSSQPICIEIITNFVLACNNICAVIKVFVKMWRDLTSNTGISAKVGFFEIWITTPQKWWIMIEKSRVKAGRVLFYSLGILSVEFAATSSVASTTWHAMYGTCMQASAISPARFVADASLRNRTSRCICLSTATKEYLTKTALRGIPCRPIVSVKHTHALVIDQCSYLISHVMKCTCFCWWQLSIGFLT